MNCAPTLRSEAMSETDSGIDLTSFSRRRNISFRPLYTPQALWLLLAVPLLIAFYVLLLRRRTKAAVRYASIALFRDALTGGARIRRHVPPLLFLLALVALIIAVARPRAAVTLPSEQRTIILATDTSLSMRATDVAPSRNG